MISWCHQMLLCRINVVHNKCMSCETQRMAEKVCGHIGIVSVKIDCMEPCMPTYMCTPVL